MKLERTLQGSMPSRLILLPTVAAVVGALTACDDTNSQGQKVETFTADQAQYAAICTDPKDRANPDDDVRVNDDLCGDSDEEGHAQHSGFSYIFMNLGPGHHTQTIPAHGQTVPRGLGTTTHPKGSVIMRKLPSGQFTISQIKTGVVKPASPIQRGGFGVTAGKGSSGG